MKLYLDTGNIEEIREVAALGVLDGVTTNPTLIAREGKDFTQVIREIVGILKATGKEFTVSAEVTDLHADKMVEQGRALAAIDPHVVVKVPLIPEGIAAVHRLSREGIRTNVTLCFSTNQALLAAKAGAFIVSPFVGRLDDIGEQGLGLIRDIRRVFDNYHFTTQILTASIRHPLHVTEAALAGSDIATIPKQVFMKLFHHPLTEQGNEKFLRDWRAYEEQLRRGTQHGGAQ
ncbi:fructose-6-phosphate aldolase [Candidatus Woesearchaeota archaeon]|nr:MAG: fructose-6-phosphate aldolase [Candidatus Woesearchaeota archaeon]